jgi:glucokinase
MGIDMGASHLHFALADLQGEIQREYTQEVQPEAGPQKLISQIKEGVRQLAQVNSGRGRTGKREGEVLAIAIGVPSPVDPKSGITAWANNLPGWENIHLGREVEEEFGVPVVLENDGNMAALGEHWRGVAQGVETFVFIALGTGIGSGIFVDGKLHRGRTGAAGELYNMNIEWRRWAEVFPDTGYFENYVSGMGIAAEGRRILGSAAKRKASSLREERDARFVFQAWRKGNPKAAEVLEKTFTMLGVGVVNIVAILDPDLIVFGGGIAQGAPEPLLSTVKKVVGHVHRDPPRIMLSSLQDKAQTYGAILSALTKVRGTVN